MSWKQAGVNFIRMAVLLVLVSMAAFFLVSVSPLDPLTTNVGQAALGTMSQEQVERLGFVPNLEHRFLIVAKNRK